MATSFTEIYDQFSMFVKDYNLIALYNASVSDYEIYLSGWLIPAITDFRNCNQSLAYTSSTFTETLSTDNIKILALLMKKYWLKKEINDITQMNLHVQDRDFKTFAEANNMLEKRKTYQGDLEELSQQLTEYTLANTDWSSWYAGNFYVP